MPKRGPAELLLTSKIVVHDWRDDLRVVRRPDNAGPSPMRKTFNAPLAIAAAA
jgi:hypothetical protein